MYLSTDAAEASNAFKRANYHYVAGVSVCVYVLPLPAG